MFLPIGKRLAIDAALDRTRDRDIDHCAKNSYFSVAAVGLLLQALYVYFFGALLKAGPEWLPTGSAVYIALHLDSFVTPFGMILRDLLPLTLLLTYFVFLIELLAPVLLFFPDKNLRVRSLTLGLLIAMHLGFRLFLDIGHFWLVSIASLCAYIPGNIWDSFEKFYWAENKRKIRIYYDRDCGFCLKICLILREFFLPKDVTVAPAQDVPGIGELLERENSWVVETPQGGKLLRWDALSYILCQSPLLYPIGLLSRAVGAIGLGGLIYAAIAYNRAKLGRLTAWLLPWRSLSTRSPIILDVFLVAIISFCFLWNIGQSLPEDTRQRFLQNVTGIAALSGLAQRWDMFAPRPAYLDGYLIATAKTADGRTLHVREGRLAGNYVRPENLSDIYSSYRWRKHVEKLIAAEGKKRESLAKNYAHYICKTINARGELVIHSVQLVHSGNMTIVQKEGEFTDRFLGKWDCPPPRSSAIGPDDPAQAK